MKRMFLICNSRDNEETIQDNVKVYNRMTENNQRQIGISIVHDCKADTAKERDRQAYQRRWKYDMEKSKYKSVSKNQYNWFFNELAKRGH